MKKNAYIGVLSALILMVVTLFVGCGGDPAKKVTKGRVNYEYIGGTYRVTGAASSATNITIKRKISGRTVSGIQSSAFKDNTTLQSVTFETGTYSDGFDIANHVFSGSKIRSITNMPKETKIYFDVFALMENIQTITMQENSADIFVRNGLLYRVFSNETYLIKVPTNLTALPEGWADGVDAIDTGALDYTAVSDLDIPASIDFICSSAIMNPQNLKSLTLRNKTLNMPSNSIPESIFNKNFRLYIAADATNIVSYFTIALVSSYPFITHPTSCTSKNPACGLVHGQKNTMIYPSMEGYSYTRNNENKTIDVQVGQNYAMGYSAPYLFID